MCHQRYTLDSKGCVRNEVKICILYRSRYYLVNVSRYMEGTNGPCSSKTITLLTLLHSERPKTPWSFGRFECNRVNGTIAPQKIVRIGLVRKQWGSCIDFHYLQSCLILGEVQSIPDISKLISNYCYPKVKLLVKDLL